MVSYLLKSLKKPPCLYSFQLSKWPPELQCSNVNQIRPHCCYQPVTFHIHKRTITSQLWLSNLLDHACLFCHMSCHSPVWFHHWGCVGFLTPSPSVLPHCQAWPKTRKHSLVVTWSRKCGSGFQLHEPAVVILPSSLPMASPLHMVLTLKSWGGKVTKTDGQRAEDMEYNLEPLMRSWNQWQTEAQGLSSEQIVVSQPSRL